MRQAKRCFGPCKRHCLTVVCVHLSCTEVCKSAKKIAGFSIGVMLRPVLYLVHGDRHAYRDEVMPVVVSEGKAIHVACRTMDAASASLHRQTLQT